METSCRHNEAARERNHLAGLLSGGHSLRTKSTLGASLAVCATQLKGLAPNGPFLRALWKLVAAITKPPGNAIIWRACFQAATAFELNRPRLGATLAVAVAVAGLVAAVVVGVVAGIVAGVVRKVMVIVAVVLVCCCGCFGGCCCRGCCRCCWLFFLVAVVATDVLGAV